MKTSSVMIVVTDIEGTTTPISFVKDVLFPYVLKNVERFLDENWTDAEIQRHVDALRDQSLKDAEAQLDGVVLIPSNEDTAEIKKKVVENIKWQMASDRKITALKGFQGSMWKRGYEAGELLGVVYDDVVDALKEWKRRDVPVYVYSSGSIAAQKLIFGFSDHGDLTPYFSGYFDTTIGSKLESTSYEKIALEIKAEPKNILFLSDNPGELRAASAVGYQTALLERPGNALVEGDYKSLTSFKSLI